MTCTVPRLRVKSLLQRGAPVWSGAGYLLANLRLGDISSLFHDLRHIVVSLFYRPHPTSTSRDPLGVCIVGHEVVGCTAVVSSQHLRPRRIVGPFVWGILDVHASLEAD